MAVKLIKESKLTESHDYWYGNDESRFEEDKADFNHELKSGSFWDSRTTPKATMGRIADILLNVQDYLGHFFGDDGLQYFTKEFLPKAVKSGIKYGIDPDKLKFVKNWFDSGRPDEMAKKIWSESYARKESVDSSVTDYKVFSLKMDVAVPGDKSLRDFGVGSTDPRNPLYNAISKALESVGLEMAGDYIDSDGDVTDVYKDNDYEFFNESKSIN